jgi:hypothetical protein
MGNFCLFSRTSGKKRMRIPKTIKANPMTKSMISNKLFMSKSPMDVQKTFYKRMTKVK